MRLLEIIARVYRGRFYTLWADSCPSSAYRPLAAVHEVTQPTEIRHRLDCYDYTPSARCLSFRQTFSSPTSTDSSSPRVHPSCSSNSDGSSTMTSPLPSPGSWHTTRQLSGAVVIDSPSHSGHSMAALSRTDPLRTVGAAFCRWRPFTTGYYPACSQSHVAAFIVM